MPQLAVVLPASKAKAAKPPGCGVCLQCLNPRLRLECAERGRNKYTEEELLAKIAALGGGGASQQARRDKKQDFVSDIGAVIDDDGYFSSPSAVGPFMAAAAKHGAESGLRTFMIKEALAKIQPRVTAPFVEQGGLDLLADWMNDVREEDGPSASENLRKLLTVCKKLPVSEASLRASKVGKAVKKLTKVGDMSVQRQAKEVMKEWMRAITGKGTVTPPANAPSSPRPVSRPAAKPTEQRAAPPPKGAPPPKVAPPQKVAQPPKAAAPAAAVPATEKARAPKLLSTTATDMDSMFAAPPKAKLAPRAPVAPKLPTPTPVPTKVPPVPSVSQGPKAPPQLPSVKDKGEPEAKLPDKADAPAAPKPPARAGRSLSSFLSDSTAAPAAPEATRKESGDAPAPAAKRRAEDVVVGKDADAAAPPAKKKKRKSVSWAPDDVLVKVKYFTKDSDAREDERQKKRMSTADLAKQEHERERQARQKVLDDRRARLEAMSATRSWDVPAPSTPDDTWAAGEKSKEKGAQASRELGVLAAVYPALSAVPDSPAEPVDVGPEQFVGVSEPTEIPLNDAEGAAVKNVASPAQKKVMSAVPQAMAAPRPSQAPQMHQQQARPPPPPPRQQQQQQQYSVAASTGLPSATSMPAPTSAPLAFDSAALMKLQQAISATMAVPSAPMQTQQAPPPPPPGAPNGGSYMMMPPAQQQQMPAAPPQGQQQQHYGFGYQQQQQQYSNQQQQVYGQQLYGQPQPQQGNWQPPLPPGPPRRH